MEKKVGEIFEANGIKYQCIRYNPNKCKECDLNGKILCLKNTCINKQRKDNTEVIFKEIKE